MKRWKGEKGRKVGGLKGERIGWRIGKKGVKFIH